MNWLAFDTSTEQASVALFVGGVMYRATEPNLRQHAKLLLPMIDDLLTSAGVACQDLNGIVFGCGPGSFTGLRIACSMAQGLAYATNLPLYPVNSLLAIMADVFQQGRVLPSADVTSLSSAPGVLVMLDARMQEVYWAYGTDVQTSLACHVSSAADIQILGETPLILAGVGLDIYASQLTTSIQSRVVEQHVLFPRAEVMIRWVESGAIEAVGVEHALPTYVRHHVTQGVSRG